MKADLDDGLVVVGATGHLAGEEGDHLGEVHRAVSLVQHTLQVYRDLYAHMLFYL